MAAKPTLHIGKLIKLRIQENGMTKSEFARRINTSPQNIYGIFKRKSIDTELLREISRVLHYDFFQYYTGTRAPSGVTVAEVSSKLSALERENEVLRNENAYLKEINELLKRKSK